MPFAMRRIERVGDLNSERHSVFLLEGPTSDAVP